MVGEGRAVGGREGGWVEEAWYARAVVWMRGLGFDPKSETEIGIAGRELGAERELRWREEERIGA